MRDKKCHKIILFGVGLFFCLLFLLPKLAYAQTITVAQIFQLINKERLNQNLKALTINDKLERTAAERAQDMMEKKYFSHQTPEGLMPWDIAIKEGYNYEFIGENLAVDWTRAEEIVKAWMSSAKHRANILNENFSETGIAVLEKYGHYLVVQIFGKELGGVKMDQPASQPMIAPVLLQPENANMPLISESNAMPSIISDNEVAENLFCPVLPMCYAQPFLPHQSILGAASLSRESIKSLPIVFNANYCLFLAMISFFPIAFYRHWRLGKEKTSS